jgi:hypothetical protein
LQSRHSICWSSIPPDWNLGSTRRAQLAFFALHVQVLYRSAPSRQRLPRWRMAPACSRRSPRKRAAPRMEDGRELLGWTRLWYRADSLFASTRFLHHDESFTSHLVNHAYNYLTSSARDWPVVLSVVTLRVQRRSWVRHAAPFRNMSGEVSASWRVDWALSLNIPKLSVLHI